MSVFNYRKFKISLSANSSKVQGLRVGDIVRRQYFDAQLKKNADGSYSGKDVGIVYSLMCVLETGIDLIPAKDDDGSPMLDDNGDQVKQKQAWFIGALLEGEAPADGELLDFVRITNLFDTDRSGAIYLTASDSNSPYMDVIDGIGRNESLSWPEDVCKDGLPDCETQYNAIGGTSNYIGYDGDGHNRVVRLVKQNGAAFTGLKQDFYKYVTNPNMVLVSYWAKANANVSGTVSLEYVNGSKTDGSTSIAVGTEWKYYFHAITVDWSGRHLRTLKLDFSSMSAGQEVFIADFNIILLSSVSNFKDSSHVRIGRLDGMVDPVFGRLDGYGGYMQKLFASQSAHISGTLTAGDENGFGSSFYAGKIHKNVLINSLGIKTVSSAATDNATNSPTGVGRIIKTGQAFGVIAQSNSWIKEHLGQTYTYSFWVYCKKPCVLELTQNGKAVGALYINVLQTHTWTRLSRTFELQSFTGIDEGKDLILSLKPLFKEVSDTVFGNDYKDNHFTNSTDIAQDNLISDANELLFSSPQLEAGSIATQYQPTDETLNYTEDYGAWFDRGGIGGTIQNPLLRLNYDGDGGIASRQNTPDETPSFALNQNGSGHIAHGSVSWDEDGNVTLDERVHLSWENLSDSAKQELAGKSIRIIGADTFSVLGNAGVVHSFEPSSITLRLEEVNLKSSANNRKWQYLSGATWTDFPAGQLHGETLTLSPSPTPVDYWNGVTSLLVRCVVSIGGVDYIDSFTLRKQFVTGYVVEIESVNGTIFKNGNLSTTLIANVYCQDKKCDEAYCKAHIGFMWSKYSIINGTYTEDTDFWTTYGIDRTKQTIELNYKSVGADSFSCEIEIL